MSDVRANIALRNTLGVQRLQDTFGVLTDDNLKLRATAGKNGSVQLFATDRATGFWGRLTGQSQQRDTARGALEKWFNHQYGPNPSADAMAVFNRHMAKPDLRVGDLKALLRDLGIEAPGAEPEPAQRGGEVPSQEDTQRRLRPFPPRDPGWTPPDELGPPAPHYNLGPAVFTPGGAAWQEPGPSSMANAFKHTPAVEMNGTLSWRRDGFNRPVPDRVQLGGTNYRVHEEPLGEGGNGVVHLAEDDRGNRIAVKLPQPRVDLERFETEADLHLRVLEQKGDVDHVLQLKGILKNRNNETVGIAMELMPHGDVKDAAEKIDAALARKDITRDEARLLKLTLLKDMTAGLAQFHAAGAMMHLDVKPANFLIDAQGVAKISDFGTIFPDNPETMDGPGMMGTPAYKAPEGTGGHFGERVLAGDAMLQGIREQQARVAGADDLHRAAEVEALAALKVGYRDKMPSRQSDVFSLGLSAVQMFKGLDELIKAETRQCISAMGEGDLAARETAADKLVGRLGITGNAPENRLMRAMLAPRAMDRPAPPELLTMPPLNEPGVGAPETRDLLVRVLGGAGAEDSDGSFGPGRRGPGDSGSSSSDGRIGDTRSRGI